VRLFCSSVLVRTSGWSGTCTTAHAYGYIALHNKGRREQLSKSANKTEVTNQTVNVTRQEARGTYDIQLLLKRLDQLASLSVPVSRRLSDMPQILPLLLQLVLRQSGGSHGRRFLVFGLNLCHLLFPGFGRILDVVQALLLLDAVHAVSLQP